MIQAKMLFYARRQFDANRYTGGLAMGYGRNGDNPAFILLRDRKHNHTRPVLAPFVVTGFMLIAPQIGIGNHHARFRVWN